MEHLFLIGIGTGNPEHVTGEARRTLREADLILIPRKGPDKADLVDLRQQICAEVLDDPAAVIREFDLPVRDASGDYRKGVEDWHDAIAMSWAEAIARHDTPVHRVALLIWGDPSLYDSSLRIAARLTPQPMIRVIPGITAMQALTAAHAIPVNEIGAPFIITTGRQIRDHGWPANTDTAIVMLDGQCSFQSLPAQEEYDIWWGAYLGMKEELLIRGPLDIVANDIVDRRARARAEHGWIMDIYLLRRRG
ncbi:precorrin-6A synthase (deacetylating) [Phaeobacter sp. 22II1-1F12B]|uniref:precorrin-6A synthase (deacetylating) n=1 Tax=Phaeobacter sp. 22II1-1F12B TaxID=1317111 RepID=UPI000B52701B|nr:precorrin-6A synthase (deacetylating) [Phaeobacter sp. 22II1-1F12B]OWU81512.1 precorrin 6A synthase [Phaeobacter sp. 22II1-1F12B]